MAGHDALASLAEMLANLPDESVESILVTFDSLVDVSDASVRPVAAQMLRDSAEGCRNPTRRDRMLRASRDVAAGPPCALTAAGLTSQQAMAALTGATSGVTVPVIEEFQWPAAATPPPPAGEDEDEDGENSEDPYMEGAPPPLPHLPVRHFFPGLVVRVAQDFRDAHGRAVCAQDLLKVLTYEAVEDGYSVSFLERTVALRTGVAGHADILENGGNAWFQPVPSAGCLDDLAEVIGVRLDEAESEAEDEEEEDDERLELIDALRADVAECQEWVMREGKRGPAPKCPSSPMAAEVFGRDDTAAAWIRLLFAAILVCTG